jgi:hypothetical protein
MEPSFRGRKNYEVGSNEPLATEVTNLEEEVANNGDVPDVEVTQSHNGCESSASKQKKRLKLILMQKRGYKQLSWLVAKDSLLP